MKAIVMTQLILLIWIAAIIINLLIKAEDGALRKIMIGYFSTEIFFLLGILLLEIFKGDKIFGGTQIVLMIILFPKLLIKIIFYNYINIHF